MKKVVKDVIVIFFMIICIALSICLIFYLEDIIPREIKAPDRLFAVALNGGHFVIEHDIDGNHKLHKNCDVNQFIIRGNNKCHDLEQYAK